MSHAPCHTPISPPPKLGARTGDTVVVGLGSAHGDDQIGWLVANEIARQLGSGRTVFNLTSPIDLTCRLEVNRNAVIIDAVHSDHVASPALRWVWPSPELAVLRRSGTHAIGLPESLELAAQLGRLPESVVIWGIAGRTFAPGQDVSSELQSLVPQLAAQIIHRDLLVAQHGG